MYVYVRVVVDHPPLTSEGYCRTCGQFSKLSLGVCPHEESGCDSEQLYQEVVGQLSSVIFHLSSSLIAFFLFQLLLRLFLIALCNYIIHRSFDKKGFRGDDGIFGVAQRLQRSRRLSYAQLRWGSWHTKSARAGMLENQDPAPVTSQKERKEREQATHAILIYTAIEIEVKALRFTLIDTFDT